MMNKMLMVDDDEIISLIYEEELFDAGYQVITTRDCEGLMELIEHHRPDLIILAVRMRHYDGLDALQDIRNSFYDMPVILCSRYPALRYDPRAIAADYFVVKSSNLNELKSTIQMAMESTIPLPDLSMSQRIKGEGSNPYNEVHAN